MRIIKLLVATFIISLSAPALAGPSMWRDIEAGMSSQQVQSLYPESAKVKHGIKLTALKDVAITEKCAAEIDIHHPTGMVDKIAVKGNPSMGGRCSDTVLTALSSKYGQPLGQSDTHSSILAREGKIYIWNKDSVTIRFKRFSNGALAGGGLLKASWELTYTTVGSDINL